MTSEQPLPAGTTIRFRVNDPGRGLQSTTWNVVGAKNSGDLYFGGRETIGEFKLSVHESGITRMAWTGPVADRHVEPGQDRALSRWVRDPAATGWRVGLRLTMLDSLLPPALAPVPGIRPKPVVNLPPAGPGRAVVVRVLLGVPGRGDIQLDGELEEVGRMLLGNGTRVWVVAYSEPVNEALAQEAERARRAVLAEAGGRHAPRAFAWGSEHGTGVPSILDLGDPRPEGERPEVYPPHDGPANLWIGEMPDADAPA